MDVFDIQPIPNQPALFIKRKRILIIADLHIGIESQLREQGVATSSNAEKMISHLLSICKKYKAKEIVLLGDIKHNIPSASIQERRDVRTFLETIKEHGSIHIIPGNHDGFIEKLSPFEANLYPSHGVVIEDIGFAHGHRWPSEDIMKCKQIVIGHTHPTIVLTDRLNYKSFEPCWIKATFLDEELKEKYPNIKNSQILIMPAFNPLCGGIAVNKDGITGPLKKIIDIENAEVFLLDGSSLGKVKNVY
jgi:putative SbcD/Mre11-related phosphoesterase